MQQALAGSLGLIGRVVSLAMFGVGALAAATAAWTTPLATLAGILPTGLAAKLLNWVAIPGFASAPYAIVGLAIWTVGAYGVAIWATSSKRAKSAADSTILAA